MNDPNWAISSCCNGCIDGELSTMNNTSSRFSNDAGKSLFPTRVGSGVGATNELALHAQIAGKTAPSNAQRTNDQDRRTRAATRLFLKASMTASYEEGP
jgi:hypothetical protein